MKDIKFKGTPGYKLLLWGLTLTALPFLLIIIDLGVRGGGDANIAIGLLALVFLPAGPILAAAGLVMILRANFKK